VDESSPSFADTWARADAIEGWLTRDQAAVLFEAARSLPPGSTVVEIGSHQGRSTVVLASGLTAGGRVMAVDPFDADWRYGAPDTHTRLLEHLTAAGVVGKVDVVAATSRAARASYEGVVGLVYVDGRHDYRTVRDDLTWAARVPDGGVVLVHDAFSSIGVTLALLTVCTSGEWRYRGRIGSLAEYERVHSGRARELAAHVRELPWFARNGAIKVLVLAGRRRWAERIGLDPDAPWPY